MKRSILKTKGFTLIELIVVIVILGIMAAIAGPKFVGLQTDARISVLKGVEGAVRSAATLAYSRALINGTETAATANVDMAGTTVAIVYGYPSLVGIGNALDLSSDVSYDNTTGVFSLKTNCTITYNIATSVAGPPQVITPANLSVPVTSGC